MRIVQGLLPNNNVSVDPSTFLAAWMNSVQVYELGLDSFKNGRMQFVFSGTEPPASSIREYATLWFKRGDGRLYLWDYSDLPSGPTETTDATGRLNWLSISERKEVWAETLEAMPAGTPFYFARSSDYSAPIYNNSTATEGNLTKRGWDPGERRLFTLSAFGAPNAGTTGVRSCTTGGMMFIAMETTSSGGRARFCEMGFCDMLMNSSHSGLPGPLFTSAVASNTQFCDGHPGGYTLPSINSIVQKWAYYGFLCDSSGSSTGVPWLRRGFKQCVGSWQPTGGV